MALGGSDECFAADAVELVVPVLTAVTALLPEFVFAATALQLIPLLRVLDTTGFETDVTVFLTLVAFALSRSCLFSTILEK